MALIAQQFPSKLVKIDSNFGGFWALFSAHCFWFQNILQVFFAKTKYRIIPATNYYFSSIWQMFFCLNNVLSLLILFIDTLLGLLWQCAYRVGRTQRPCADCSSRTSEVRSFSSRFYRGRQSCKKNETLIEKEFNNPWYAVELMCFTTKEWAWPHSKRHALESQVVWSLVRV